ncbi:MAG: M1 family aminopeptidase [Myxococcota bacterium]|nr:M1 family aminopeptidase [Myxococcota bacterium]
MARQNLARVVPTASPRVMCRRRWRQALCHSILLLTAAQTFSSLAIAQRAQSTSATFNWAEFQRLRGETHQAEARALRAYRLPPRRLGGEEFGSYNLLHIRSELPIDGLRFPDRARHQVTLVPSFPAARFAFISFNWTPNRILFEGLEVPFESLEDGLITEINLGVDWPEGEPLELEIEATLSFTCEELILCNDTGAYPHSITPGILPLNPEGFERDYFLIELIFLQTTEERVHPMGTGRVVERAPEEGRWHFETEQINQIPAFSLHWVEPEPFDELIELSPATPGGFNVGVGPRIRESLDLLESLYFPYPFSRLGASTVDDFIGAAIGPQGNIFLPETFWDPRAYEVPEIERLISSVIAHEVAHQYFFNSVFVAGEGASWLSEGFAEYSSDRFAERRYGDDLNRRGNYWAWLGAVPPEQDLPLASAAVDESPQRTEFVYSKGATILHTLRNLFGERFEEALRAYVVAFNGQFTSNEELQESLESGLDASLASFFDQWVYGEGYPTLTVEATWRPVEDEQGVLDLYVSSKGQSLPWLNTLQFEELQSARTEWVFEEHEYSGEGPIEFSKAFQGGTRALRVEPNLRFPHRIENLRPSDVNLSGVVDGADFLDLYFATRQGLELPDPRWAPLLDLDGNQRIDRGDIESALSNFGAGLPRTEEEPEID